MNSKPFAFRYFFPIAVLVCFSVVLLAWAGQKQPHQQKITDQNTTDTTPKTKTDKKIQNLDDALDELNDAEMKLNMDKVNAEVQKAMKSIDMQKMKIQMDEAMKAVDMEKIKAEVQKATKDIDAAKIDQQIKESLAKVDMEKVNQELKKQMDQMKNIDMSELNKQMENLKIQMNDLGPKIEKQVEKAKVQIEKAKAEMMEYKNFVDGLEKDGLINEKEGYTIEHKNGELIINGKKQPANLYDKYRGFLQKHKKFTIKKSDDGFNIGTGNSDII
jgi:CBS-domain-containing membrane protein